MRKRTSVAFLAVLGLLLFGCGKKTTKDTPTTTKAPTPVTTAKPVTTEKQVKKYTVAVVNSIQNAGTISGAGQVEEGKSVTLTATPNDGYIFLGYYASAESTTALSTEATYTVSNVQADVTITAKWAAKSFTLAVKTFSNVDPDDVVEFTDDSLGSVEYEVKEQYATGETIHLTATPKEGYQFNGWYLVTPEGDHPISTDAEFDLTMYPSNTTIKALFGTKKCTIELVSNITEAVDELTIYTDVEGEFINKTLTTNYGTEVNIYINEANDGYTFKGFYLLDEDGEYNPDELLDVDYYFTATDSAKYLAFFEANVYDLFVNENIDKGGTYTGVYKEVEYTEDDLDGGFSISFKESITLTATAEDGYTFVGWYSDSEFENQIATDATYTYTMTVAGDNYIYAKYVANDVQVNFTVDTVDGEGNPTGTINESGKYAFNSEIALTATPNTGYKFDGWFYKTLNAETGEYDYTLISDNANYQFPVETTEEINIYAKFSQIVYIGDGYININGLDETYYDLVCDQTDQEFVYGQELTLVAPTIPGYTFVGWYNTDYSSTESEDLEAAYLMNTNSTYTFNWNLTESSCITACYARQLIKLNYNTNGGDDTSVEFVKVKFGIKTTLEVPTRYGYAFQYWDYSDEDGVRHQLTNSNGEMLEPLALLQETTIRAKWLDGKVIASFDTDGGSDIDDQEVTFNHTIERPTDPEKDGYEFVGWFDNNGIAWSFSQAIVQNTTLYAHWNILQFEIALESQDDSIVTVNSSKIDGTYDFDTVLTIEATVAQGYSFAGWYEGTTLVSSDATYAYHLPSHDVTLTATYTVNTYTLTVQVIRRIGSWIIIDDISATGAGTYEYGEEVTITTTLDHSGHKIFDYYGNISGSWAVLQNSSSVTNPYKFNMPYRDCTVQVRIYSNSFNVSVSKSTNTGSEGIAPRFNVASGSDQTSGYVLCDRDVKLTAYEISGYTFQGWYEGTTKITDELVYSFTMTNQARSFEAKYAENYYTLVVNKNVNDHNDETEDVSSISTNNVVYKGTKTLSVSAMTGYTFLGWYDGTTKISSDLSFTYTMPKQGKTIVAKFEINTYSIYVDYGISNTDYNLIPGTFNFEDDEYYSYDYNIKLTLTATAYDGWTFKGFYVTDDYDNGFDRSSLSDYTLLTSNEFTIPAYSVCIYPVFEAKQYNLIYYANGGTVANPGKKVTMGDSFTLDIPTYTGQDFVGWYYVDSDLNKIYLTESDGESLTYYNIPDGMNIQAQWGVQLKSVTFETGYNASTYDANDTKAFTNKVEYNSAVARPDDPIRKGYTFVGWFDSEEDDATEWLFTTPITIDTTIYAHWTVNSYTVKLVNQSASRCSYTYYVNSSINGTVTSSSGVTLTLEYGAVIKVEVTYFLGNRLNAWNYNNGTNQYWLSVPETGIVNNFATDVTIMLYAQSKVEMANFTFTSTTTSCTITGLTSSGISATELVVPDYVTAIMDGAFAANTSLVSLTTPFIGLSRNATYENKIFAAIFGSESATGLTKISGKYLDSSNTVKDVVKYVPSSLRNVTITDETSVGAYAFYNISQVKSYTLNEGITRIGTQAFYYFTGSSLTLPDTLTTIDEEAFRFSYMTTFVIPDSVTSIGKGALLNCYYLNTLTVPFVGQKDNTSGLGEASVFGWIFGKSTNTSSTYNVLQKWGSNSTQEATYSIPNSLKNVTITGGSITGSYTYITYGAFMNCTSLTSITINKYGKNFDSSYNTRTISNYAFSGCTNLRTISGDYFNTTYIRPYAFYECTSLTAISCIGYYVSEHAFDGCTSLESFTQNANSYSYVYFDPYAFRGCSALTELNLNGNGRLCIYSYAFADCSSLESFNYPTRTCAGNLQYAFSGCSSLKNFSVIFMGSLGQYAFKNCTSLTSIEIMWDGSATASNMTIGDGAFVGCTGLTDVTIDSKVTSIGAGIFGDCNKLTNLTVPYIGKDANATSTNLTTYSFYYSFGYFFGTSATVSNMVSTGTVAADPTNNNFPSGYKQTITSAYYPKAIKTVTITAPTYIGAYAFANVRNCKFAVEFASASSYYIGKCAFFWSGIQSVTFGSGLKSIADCAFYDGYIYDLELPAGLTTIGNYAFGAQVFTDHDVELVLPDSLTTLGTKVFYDPYTTYNNIVKITLGSGITNIAANAFYGVSDSIELCFNGTLNEFGTKRQSWPDGWNYVSSSISIFSCYCIASNNTATWQ